MHLLAAIVPLTFTVLFLAYCVGYVVCLFRWTGGATEQPDPAVVRFTRVTVSDDDIGAAGVTVKELDRLHAGGTGR